MREGSAVDTAITSSEPREITDTHRRGSDTRPGLAIVSNCITPYRIHLHRLIAAGIPELRLHTLATHGVGEFDWQVNLPPEIHAANVSDPGDRPTDKPFRRPWGEIQKASRLERYFEENNVRVAVFNGYNYTSYLKLMNYCYRQQIPFFLRSDSNIRSENRLSRVSRICKRIVYRWWMKRAAGIFSMGRLGDQFFLKYGADPKKLYRVPYWPDFDSFARVDSWELERFQRKFGLDGRRSYLVFSGRLARVKRVDLLIDAFAAIAESRPNWDLVIVGDGALKEKLRQQVPEALQSRVVWTGFVEGADSVSSYHAADVLVLPSDFEPWALVVQEAMAAGLTVVASDIVGAAYELVTDKVSGRIFTAGDRDLLREALEDVTHPERTEEYKRQSTVALKQYLSNVDPVAEIRRALTDAGILGRSVPPNLKSDIQPSHGQ